MCRPEEATGYPLDYYMICMVCEEWTAKERSECPICNGKGRIDWGAFCDELAVQARLANKVVYLERQIAMLKRKLEGMEPLSRREWKELTRPLRESKLSSRDLPELALAVAA